MSFVQKTPSDRSAQKAIWVWGYVVALAAMWTLAVGGVLTGEILHLEDDVRNSAKSLGRRAVERDVALRRWASLHGGVYVPLVPGNSPDPYLADHPRRDLVTKAEEKLTLVCPSAVNRQFQDLLTDPHFPRSRATSLAPIRAEDAPDPWERQALESLAAGHEEVASVEAFEGRETLRLMRPLWMEESCRGCHVNRAYQTGELRGGISVAVPLDRFREEARAEALLRAEHYGLLWLVGLVGIVLGGRRLQQQARRRLGVEQELREARDLLEQRVAERTADLEQTNERLRDQIAERQRAEEEARSAQQRLLEHQQRQKELAEAELAKLQDQLVRQTQLATIGRVSASIAHELRNPLGAVRNAAYLLKRKLPRDQTRLQEYLRMIEEETSRADLIITELMAMTRGKAPDRQATELGKIVAAARQRCAAPAQFQWSSTYDPDPLLVNVDAVQLEQVFRNLFTNAIHASGASGWVGVEAKRRDSDDEILVTDSGPGIASNLRRQVFEPLYTTKSKGTGMGLAICRQIIERHGGSIEVIDGPRGAAFRIRLLHDAKQAEDPS